MKKGYFFWKKGPQKVHPSPLFNSFLSVLHHNKALYNFHKKGQRPIVKCNIGLEYALTYQIVQFL